MKTVTCSDVPSLLFRRSTNMLSRANTHLLAQHLACCPGCRTKAHAATVAAEAFDEHPVETRRKGGEVRGHEDLGAAWEYAEESRESDDPVWKISFQAHGQRVRLIWESCRWVWRPVTEEVAEAFEERGDAAMAVYLRTYARNRNDSEASFERFFGDSS